MDTLLSLLGVSILGLFIGWVSAKVVLIGKKRTDSKMKDFDNLTKKSK